jgi:uncharacterized radical SAM superfamily Fe-S cluster-containing enzyme
MKLLKETQSICPICHKALMAQYVLDEGKVYLTKTCQEHGNFQSFVAEDDQEFLKWIEHPVVNVPPKKAQTTGAGSDSNNDGLGSQCPLHCGTCENHLQTACCVLIDITDRCNQHCPYCFARAEEEAGNEPSMEEIERKYDLLLELGEERPFNIQLSGGEPTVREDLPEIIQMGREKGFEYIQINTNGRRLALEDGYTKKLKAAGATVIYLQFDGTRDEIYEELRGEPLLDIKKKAISNCKKAGLPVILVPTIVRQTNLNNSGEMMQFLLTNIDVVKGIHFQPVSFFGRHPDKPVVEKGKWGDFENRVTMFDIMHEIENQTAGKFRYYDFCPITTGHPLCCFYGTYRKERNGSVTSLISDETKKSGVSCCDMQTPLDVIKKDRDYVLVKWDLPEEDDPDYSDEHTASECSEPIMSFDEFIKEMKRSLFTVSGMAFQDGSNLDADRLKRCRVQVLSEDDRLIPFCAYNSIYR